MSAFWRESNPFPGPLTHRCRPADRETHAHSTRCAKEKDPEDPTCKKFQSFYRSICPTEWVRARRCSLAAVVAPTTRSVVATRREHAWDGR